MSQRQGSEPEHLDGTIAFLNMTSKLIDTFADTRPISSLDDHRLAMNHEILEYFQKWEMDAESHQELSKADRTRRLLSQKLRFDISSMIIGFQEVCKIAFIRFPGSTISPFRTNVTWLRMYSVKKGGTTDRILIQRMHNMAQP